ncbi:MAG: ATP-binding cassette domain-containing protein [Desulfobacteraceae bacterium]
MIELKDIHKSFEENDVLKGISIKIEKGEILVLIGMSGYGKSVILKHVVGLLNPDRGEVFVDGHQVNRLKGSALSDLRSRIGFLFQGGALFESMTVFENVAFPLKEKAGLDTSVIEKKVYNVLDQVGLNGSDSKYPSQLSGGMQKRAALARELVWEPEIMLFDEPTTGLDPIIGHAILNLIEEIHNRLHFTGIIITHQLERVFKIVDKVAMLHEGVIIESGRPDAILASENPLVKQFLSGDTEGPISYR